MSDKEIIEALREEIILLYNCADSEIIKTKLFYILNGDKIEQCKCPKCGEKFSPKENIKLSVKIL